MLCINRIVREKHGARQDPRVSVVQLRRPLMTLSRVRRADQGWEEEEERMSLFCPASQRTSQSATRSGAR